MTVKFPFFEHLSPFSGFAPSDVLKGLQSANPLPLDLSTFVETQRRNMQAISDAQRVILENLQIVAHRQTEMLSEFTDRQGRLAHELMNEGTPEEKIARHSEIVRKAYEKSVTHLRELAELLNRSGQDAADIINRRVSGSLSEMESSVKKSTARKAA